MRVKVSFEVEVADEIGTDDELEKYFKFKYLDYGCSTDNPFLSTKDNDPVEPINNTFEWDELQGLG